MTARRAGRVMPTMRGYQRPWLRSDVVVLDMSVQARLGVTALDALAETRDAIGRRGPELWFAGLPERARATARRTRAWREAESSGRVHDTVDAAIEAYDAPSRSRSRSTPE